MYQYKWVLLSFLSLFSLVANYVINKALSVNYSPFLTLAFTGVAQTLICFVLFAFSNERFSNFSTSNLFLSVAVAICVLGIDYGMITAYKLGGNSIIITMIVSMATVVVIPISLFIYKESLSKMQVLGVALSILSIILVVGFPKK